MSYDTDGHSEHIEDAHPHPPPHRDLRADAHRRLKTLTP